MNTNAAKHIFILFILMTLSCSESLCSSKEGSIVEEFYLSPVVQSSNSNSDSSGGNFEQDGRPIIKRSVKPNYKDFYVKGKSYDVEVNIQGCARTINNISIREKIDSELDANFEKTVICTSDNFKTQRQHISNSSNYRNISSDTIDNIIANLKNEYVVYNGSIYINIMRLASFEDIEYNYTIRSNNTGVFEITTRLRQKNSRWADMEKRDLIEVRPPEMNVISEMDRSYAIIGEPFLVSYKVLHKIGWSKDPAKFNASFDTSKEYTIDVDGIPYKEGQDIELQFEPLNITKCKINIKYNKAGLHPIPSLNIKGAIVTQEIQKIEVFPYHFVKNMQDNAIFISFFLSIILVFISYFEFSISNKELELIKKINLKDYSKTDFDRIQRKQNWVLRGCASIGIFYLFLAILLMDIFPINLFLIIGFIFVLIIMYIVYIKWKQ